MVRFGFFRLFLTLLLIGGLVAGGIALFNTGWSQGYAAGTLSVVPAGADGGAVAPRLPYAYVVPYYGSGFGGFGFFNPFGLLFGIGFFLFFFFVIGSLFRIGRWRRWSGHGDLHGPVPPWGDSQRKEPAPGPGQEQKPE